MEAVATGPKAVSERGLERPGERDRRAGERATKRPEDRRAGDTVDAEAGPALETAQRAVGVPGEEPVEGAGRKAMPRQEELQLGDVPAGRAGGQLAAPERMASEPAERVSRARADDPVGPEPGSLLEAADRAFRRRPEQSVDRSGVDAVAAERDLERGHAGPPDRCRGRGKDKRCENAGEKG